MNLRWMTAMLLWPTLAAGASDEPFGVLDIALGMSYSYLERELDFRDFNSALAQVKAGKPDLGKRGYGCLRRDDPFADIGCISHDERLDATPTREVRLHFLAGRLQQFSLSADVQQHDAVIAYLRKRYGEPMQAAPSSAGTSPGLTWQNESGQIAAYRGKDLVFVNFELVSYAGAVKRKREGVALECS